MQRLPHHTCLHIGTVQNHKLYLHGDSTMRNPHTVNNCWAWHVAPLPKSKEVQTPQKKIRTSLGDDQHDKNSDVATHKVVLSLFTVATSSGKKYNLNAPSLVSLDLGPDGIPAKQEKPFRTRMALDDEEIEGTKKNTTGKGLGAKFRNAFIEG